MVVTWLGERPAWAELPEAVGTARVLHVRADALDDVPPGATGFVADLSGARRLSRRAAAAAARAAAVVVADPVELRLLKGRRPPATLVRPPVDLERFAPEAVLRERSDRRVRRFRRFHRLPAHLILFAGPYTEDGGLHLLLDAVLPLADDVALAAIPCGPVDARYRDACDRRLLSQGPRGLLLWQVDDEELPLWYAAADVVHAAATEAALLAAAAGTPSIAVDDPSFLLLPSGLRPVLVPRGDAARLGSRIAELMRDEGRGPAARLAAERELTPEAAARALRGLWRTLGDSAASYGCPPPSDEGEMSALPTAAGRAEADARHDSILDPREVG